MDLFDAPAPRGPLADRLRPESLEEVIGQDHLLGGRSPIGAMLRSGRLSSLLLWGPPGSGKTTIAQLLAARFDLPFARMSAVTSGVAEMRKTIETAQATLRTLGKPTLLFVDEIHRWNKAQQDGLLPHVESGTVTLVGATTENPSFELNSALLSRCQVLTLKQHDRASLEAITIRAEQIVGRELPITAEAREVLLANASGDARHLLGQIDILLDLDAEASLDVGEMEALLGRRLARHDKAGDGHYNLASAFQKSVRGSDPSAAIYYAARMVEAGEDVRFLLRRLMVMASEEVGNADPTALQTVVAADHAFRMLGMPEGWHAIAQAVTYVASAPKSNAAYMAGGAARELARRTGHIDPPKRILNAPTRMMKDMGYKEGYEYSHDHPGAFSGQDYWPDEIGPQRLYDPTPRGREAEIGRRLEHWDSLRDARRRGESGDG